MRSGFSSMKADCTAGSSRVRSIRAPTTLRIRSRRTRIRYRAAERKRDEMRAEDQRSSELDLSSGAPLRFEEALDRLEALVKELETGNLPLEETIGRFEEGQKLLRLCNDLLAKAELKVKEVLRQADGTLSEADWNEENGPETPF